MEKFLFENFIFPFKALRYNKKKSVQALYMK